MPQDSVSPLVQMVGDPDFAKMDIGEQRKALTAHDPDFARMGDADMIRFVQAHQVTKQQPTFQAPAGTPDAVSQAKQSLMKLIPNLAPTPSSIVPAQGGGAHMLQAPAPGAGPAMPDPRALQFQQGQEAGSKQAAYDIGTSVLGAGVGEIASRLPSAVRAGQAFNAVQKVVGDHPVEMTDALSSSAMRIKALSEAGSSMPQAVQKFLTRVTDPEKAALTFNEARDFYSNLSRLSSGEASRLNPIMKRAVSQFTAELGNAISETAARGGKLEQFKGAMSEYRNAAKLGDAVDSAKDLVMKKMLGYGLAGTAAGAAGGYIAKKVMGK